MILLMTYIIMANKFKAKEKDVEIKTDIINEKIDEIEWEGEELHAESETKIEDDKGTGQEIIVRVFEFAADQEVFRMNRPTAQELFDSHRKGIESMLWADGLQPYQAIEPTLIVDKDKSKYTFYISCLPGLGNTLIDKTHTLSELLR